ncbi:MAG: CRTAC1 family protein [Bryobacteraceae bacterium]|nr:CRTAC1 family protein [Bryobacteraceae bacterium]
MSRRWAAAAAVLAGVLLSAFRAPAPESPIHFAGRRLDFFLDNDESPKRRAPETMAGGMAAFDYDNDGDLDLFFCNGADLSTLEKKGPKHWNRLYANDGRGHFTDITAKAGLQGSGYDTGAAVGDFDNDGWLDLFVAGVHRNTLYRNNGDGTFTDVTAKAGLPPARLPKFGPLWAVSAVWTDVNLDGFLDLFIVNYLLWEEKTEPSCPYEGRNEYCHPKYYREIPNQLFLNNGNGTFTDASERSGIGLQPGKGMGAGAADFDLDGRPDIFVSNDKLFNFFFHNLGGGKFEEKAFELGVALAEHGNMISGMGVDFRDLDNDGFPDIVLVALDNETFPVFQNTGRGSFREVTASTGMTALSRSMAGYGPTLADFDNDGWKDLLVTRGHVQSPLMEPRVQINQHNSVFRNLGKGRWQALTAEAGLDALPPARHRGSAVGDFNGDGRLDFAATALNGSAELWINDSLGANHWIAFRLRGTRSPRDGQGARVRVVSRGLTQHNHVAFTVGYASASAGPLHFGLGADDSADLVEIVWPSGQRQELRHLKAGRVYDVTEPEGPADH